MKLHAEQRPPSGLRGRTRARASLLCSGARAFVSALTPPLSTPGQNIRKLVKDGFVIKKPEKVHSRARTNAWAEAKRKVGRCQLRHRSSSCDATDHRGRGTGSRHVAARLPPRLGWWRQLLVRWRAARVWVAPAAALPVTMQLWPAASHTAPRSSCGAESQLEAGVCWGEAELIAPPHLAHPWLDA